MQLLVKINATFSLSLGNKSCFSYYFFNESKRKKKTKLFILRVEIFRFRIKIIFFSQKFSRNSI